MVKVEVDAKFFFDGCDDRTENEDDDMEWREENADDVNELEDLDEYSLSVVDEVADSIPLVIATLVSPENSQSAQD